MDLQLFSIMIEGQENTDLGFFISYKVLAENKENAVVVVFANPELDNLNKVTVEEIINLKYSKDKTAEANPGIIEKTGKAYFTLNTTDDE